MIIGFSGKILSINIQKRRGIIPCSLVVSCAQLGMRPYLTARTSLLTQLRRRQVAGGYNPEQFFLPARVNNPERQRIGAGGVRLGGEPTIRSTSSPASRSSIYYKTVPRCRSWRLPPPGWNRNSSGKFRARLLEYPAHGVCQLAQRHRFHEKLPDSQGLSLFRRDHFAESGTKYDPDIRANAQHFLC